MLKNIIRHLINNLGYTIIKKPNKIFTNAIEYNSVVETNNFYSKNYKIKKYYQTQRIKSFTEIVNYIDINFNRSGNLILDAGCGAGYFTNFISEKFNESSVYGIDFSDNAISYAKEKYVGINLKVGLLSEPFEHKYDIICCISVLEHLESPDTVLKNLINHLNPNGKLIIVVPNGRLDNFEGHIHFWSIESWDLFLKSNVSNNFNWKNHLLTSKADILSIICNS